MCVHFCKGLSHGAEGEEDVWQEFADSPERLGYESGAKKGACRLPTGVTDGVGLPTGSVHAF